MGALRLMVKYTTIPTEANTFAVGFNHGTAFHIENVSEYLVKNTDSKTVIIYYPTLETAEESVNEPDEIDEEYDEEYDEDEEEDEEDSNHPAAYDRELAIAYFGTTQIF